MLDMECVTAVEAVVRASQLCETVRASFSGAESVEKDDRSPVTVADFGAQALLVSALRRVFPADPVVAEEDAGLLRGADGDALRGRVFDFVRQADGSLAVDAMLDAIDGGAAAGGAAGRFWTIDPIDGTKGFIRGDQYAVALALVENGRVVLGVLGCPYLPLGIPVATPEPRGLVFYAVRGSGAWCRPITGGSSLPVQVSTRGALAEMVFCESFEKGHTAQGRGGRIRAALGVQAAPARLDSQCKYALVARGEADVYMRLPTQADYQEKIWDHAAGALIVEEAGGRVTDVYGRPLDFSQGRTLRGNRGVLATNGQLHDAVLKAIENETGRP